jgi:hypothetical protein
MADVLGIEIKKLIEFLLSLTIMILMIVAGGNGGDWFWMTIMTFCYLALFIIMTIAKRELGASTPLEAVFGVFSIIYGISKLTSSGFKPTELGIAAILDIILGAMFIIFMLF